MVDAQQLLKFPLHASHAEGKDSTGDDIRGGEAFPNARIQGHFHVLWEFVELLD